MSKAAIAVEGFIATELKLREAGGKSVLDVTVPVTRQKKDQSGSWVDDGDTVWFKATFWEAHAPAVLMAVGKGDLVTVTGEGVKVDLYTKADGSTAVSLVIVNPSIALVVRKPRRGEVAQSQPVEKSWAAAAQAPVDEWPATEVPL